MATNNQTYITTVQINDAQAKQKLQELEAEEKRLTKERDKAFSAGDKAYGEKMQKEINKTKKEIHKMRLETMDVSKILNNLSDASLAQLQKTAKSLNSQLRNIPPSAEKYKEIAEQLKEVNSEMAKRRSAVRGDESWTDKLANGFNKWQGAIVGAIGAITGITMTIRKSVQDYADMEEAMANVRKYTGWSDEEIRNFNEDLKKMDTRTSREELNAMAGDAGRLGITSQEAAMEFVDAADKISVALGDDLGDGAVATIGKLAQTFGDSDKMGLRGAMLATGSAVNELAASSSASAGYVVDFTSRLAGVSTQAGLAQTEIMGFASVLDQNMQQCETSATAVSQLISKMYQEPAKFAKLAGVDVQKFTKLLKEDANGALLQFLSTMQSKGGFDSLAPMFQEMGLSGTRCVGVLSTLATNLDEVKRQQDIAANAFKEGQSVLDEFNVQNETVQAGIDKAKKAFTEVSVELGEKLQPIVKYTISNTALLVKGLNELVDVIIAYSQVLVPAVVVISAYTVGMQANAIATKVSTVATKVWTTVTTFATSVTKGYTAAMVLSKDAIAGCTLANKRLYALMLAQNVLTKLITASTLLLRTAYYACTFQVTAMGRSLKSLYVVMSANPYGLILASLAAIGVAAYNNIQKQKERKRLIEEEIRQERDLMKEYDKARGKLEFLSKIVKDNNRDLDERKKALNALKKIVPHYHAELTKEGELINDNTIALKAYLVQLKESIRMKANREKLEELYAKQGELQDTEKEQSDAYWKTRQENTAQGYNRNSVTARLSRLFGTEEETNRKKDLEATQAELRDVNAKIEDLEKKVAPEFGGISNNGKGGKGNGSTSVNGTATSSSDDAQKKALARSKQILAEQNAANEIAYLKGEKLYQQYEDDKFAIQQAAYDRELAIYKKDSDDYKNTLNAKLLHEAKYAKELQKQDVEEIRMRHDIAVENINLSKLDEEAKKEAIFQVDQQYMKEELNCYEKNTKEWLDLKTKMEQEQRQHSHDLEVAWEQKAASFKKEWIKLTKEEEEQYYLDYAEQLHQKGLLSEEEYQKALKAIREAYKKEAEEREGIGISTEFDGLMASIDKLNEKLKDGKASWKDYAKVGASAIQTVMGMMSSISNLVSASAEAEIATTEAKYDKLIAAAEGNEEEQERLEKEKNEKIKKIKLQQYASERDVNIASALINVAMGITQGYAMYGPIVGSILAALTTAMGAIQIATINKNYEAQVAAVNSGYYEGGYTGGNRYRREAGVVHEGEFVANHNAVNNPELAPVLDLINQAQLNNTVGSLTRSDIASANGVQNVTPIVNVNTDNSDLKSSMGDMTSAVKELNRQLAEGVHTNISMQEFKKAEKHYNNLMNNK